MKLMRWGFGILMCLGIMFRLYQFGAIPLALNRDEAALGYNAFSILTAGVDEWGTHLPLMFRSFGDYKLPGYIYTLALFFKVFGFLDWVIRLPSLLAGFGIIALTYSIVKRLTQNDVSAMVSAALVSIQPWELFYSRMGYEAHFGLFLFLLSIYLWIHRSTVAQISGSLCLLAAVLTYNAPLLLIPVMITAIVIWPRNTWKQKRLVVFGMGLVGIVGFLILYPVTSQKQAITIMSDPTIIDAQATAYFGSVSFFEKMWNYRQIYWLRIMTMNVFDSFLPTFLTISGGQNPWHSAPNTAHLYWMTYVLAVGGLSWIMWLKKRQLRQFLAYAAILVGSLLPAMITVDAPHATRSLFFLWLLSVAAALSLSHLPKKIVPALLICFCVEFSVYGYRYFHQFPTYRSGAWPIGLRESLLQARGKYVAIEAYGQDLVAEQVYIYPLWYWRVNPITYNQTRIASGPDIVHMNRIIGFENFTTNRYNQEVPNEVIIERNIDGSYAIK